MACMPAGKTSLTVLVSADAKKKAQHALLDKKLTMSAWIDGLLHELAETSARHARRLARRISGMS